MPTAHSLPACDRQPPRAAALKAQSKLVMRPCFMTVPFGLYRILITRVWTGMTTLLAIFGGFPLLHL